MLRMVKAGLITLFIVNSEFTQGYRAIKYAIKAEFVFIRYLYSEFLHSYSQSDYLPIMMNVRNVGLRNNIVYCVYSVFSENFSIS
jgi:hypothetical protein